MKKYICIHGHFYQPPRENAWLEAIEKQESASPYHDWNERISAECYGPNGASRMLNEEQKIINIVNNYTNISYNFGPTLLSWLEKHDPDAYHNIIIADVLSRQKHNGHGNAIAQVYNHIIMPLASTRDKETQILWGISDFTKRFQRAPEGMWLAETAVDTETLELLAQNNIRFTILAPRQAKAFRNSNELVWNEITNTDTFDTGVPYLYKLPSGRTINLFFYNGKISRDVAFNGLLNSGKLFSDSLLNAIDHSKSEPHLIHIATDGESYGHHHYRGDMALAACIYNLQHTEDVVITNYGEFLDLFPPQQEIQIVENSSWSCVHGVERWRTNCGCTDGGHPEYHQKWRAPLRNALNWLKDQVDIIFEKEVSFITPNPWQLRNKYIELVLNRNENVIEPFFEKYCVIKVSEEQKVKLVRLLEMQRHAMLMFTSCGWFFDEISRIETKQILQYADRVIQIAEHETSIRLYEDFLQLLSLAPTNLEIYKNAGELYEQEIRTGRLTLTKVGMHHAIESLFEDIPDNAEMFNYKMSSEFFEKIGAGNHIVTVGKINLTSKFTFAKENFFFAALYLGEHNIIGGYAENMDAELFEEMFLKIRDAFRKSDLSTVITLIKENFGNHSFSFNDLFKDEQERIVNVLLQKDIEAAEESYKKIYESTYTLVNMLQQQKKHIPDLLKVNTRAFINSELKNIFKADRPNIFKLEQMVDEAIRWKVDLDTENISFAVSNKLYELVSGLSFKVHDIIYLEMLSKILIEMNELKLKFRLWKIQNKFFRVGKDFIGNEKFIKSLGEPEYKKWLLKFKALGEQLNIRF
ncbi:MAG: DUF3536 domain-containing protein [Bacteroidetes bacterium]|nr:DUF3536 domain-containing protein [Bacteroidota bacterium]